MNIKIKNVTNTILGCLGVIVMVSTTVMAHEGATFVDIADGDGAGIDYRRVESPRNTIFDALKEKPAFSFEDILSTPLKSRGAPGIAILDFDTDGDLDIYVTNGPGVANSLYSNQYNETGAVEFIDVGVESGIGADSQDSSGVCFGDIDNDGDDDVLVLGTCEANRLFENQGDGTFDAITANNPIGGGNRCSTSCSMGDINNDGLLDVVVANTYTNWDHQLGIFAEPFALNEHNQLYQNMGNNRFVDVSVSSGLQDTRGFAPGLEGSPTITWAIAMVDYDLDGDIDIVQADDQAAIPPEAQGGINRGYIHIFQNDGAGHFSDVTVEAGTNKPGFWMGLGFADLNCDGHMDIFGSNFGDYSTTDPDALGQSASRWFLGMGDGRFSDPGVGNGLVASVFGWGNGLFDYDNDGDYDIIYHGGLDVGTTVEASNPGVVLKNHKCSANFTYDADAVSETDHQRRTVHGVAVGDFDDNGFVDIVSVSNFDIPESVPLDPFPLDFDSPFDDAAFVQTFTPIGPSEAVFNGYEFHDGTLSVEINEGNRNNWVKVELLGTKDIIEGGSVNRNGAGSIVYFTPHRGATSMRPIVAGSSYASQHAMESIFGLRNARKGVLEVLWPGGVRNRLYNVRRGDRIRFPEIPCSYDSKSQGVFEYWHCVSDALGDLQSQNMITSSEKAHFLAVRSERILHTDIISVENLGNKSVGAACDLIFLSAVLTGVSKICLVFMNSQCVSSCHAVPA